MGGGVCARATIGGIIGLSERRHVCGAQIGALNILLDFRCRSGPAGSLSLAGIALSSGAECALVNTRPNHDNNRAKRDV